MKPPLLVKISLKQVSLRRKELCRCISRLGASAKKEKIHDSEIIQ